jgi:RNA polymerase-binding transcription factor DksA
MQGLNLTEYGRKRMMEEHRRVREQRDTARAERDHATEQLANDNADRALAWRTVKELRDQLVDEARQHNATKVALKELIEQRAQGSCPRCGQELHRGRCYIGDELLEADRLTVQLSRADGYGGDYTVTATSEVPGDDPVVLVARGIVPQADVGEWLQGLVEADS